MLRSSAKILGFLDPPRSGSLVAVVYDAVIVAAGTPIHSISVAIQYGGVLCITGDVALVQSGACAMAVRSDPHVEIMLNRKAAASAGIGFATPFRMLIHEI